MSPGAIPRLGGMRWPKMMSGFPSAPIIDLAPFLPNSKNNVYALTDLHVQMLEDIIRHEPAYWLWSHRRWKLDGLETQTPTT